MASSSTVSTGDVATAAQYNNLRIDVLDTSSGHSHTGTDSKDLGTLTADLTISQSGASQIEVISTTNDAYLILNSDTDEGQDSEIIFESGGTARGRIEYNHHATANTQLMSFFTADNAVETLKLAGNLATFATAVDLGSNTLTSTGSMQIRTIDYSDGDLAMTIADGGGVTFAQDTTFDGDIAVNGDTITADGNLTINSAGGNVYIQDNLKPQADATYDLGSSGFSWRHLHLEGDITLYGTTSTGADTQITFDGEAQDFYIGLDDGTDDLYIGTGSTVGSNGALSINGDGDIVSYGNITLDSDGAWIYMKGGGTSTNATGIAWTFNTADTRYSEIQMDYDTRASVGFLIHSGYPITIDATTQINFDISGTTYAAIDVNGNLLMNTTTVPTETGSTMSHGILIDQGADDGDAFQIRNSDVAHGFTDVKATDVFFAIRKTSGASGGAMLEAFKDADGDAGYAFLVRGSIAEAPDETTSAAALGVIQLDGNMKTSGTSRVNLGADDNLLCVSSGLDTVMLVKGDGEMYNTTTATVGVYDSYDDAQLVRALDHTRGKGVIKEKWDDFVKYNEQDLVDAGILGDTIENEGLLNVTGLQRLHNGAIWQGYTRQMELQEEVNELKTRLLALEGGK